MTDFVKYPDHRHPQSYAWLEQGHETTIQNPHAKFLLPFNSLTVFPKERKSLFTPKESKLPIFLLTDYFLMF